MDNEGIILLEIERLKMNRQQRTLIMDKGLTIYFVFLIFAILGIITESLNLVSFFVLVLMGLVILLFTSFPYIKDVIAERQTISELIGKLQKRKISSHKKKVRKSRK